MSQDGKERKQTATRKRFNTRDWRKCGICGERVAFGDGALRWYGAGGLVHARELPADTILANGQRMNGE